MIPTDHDDRAADVLVVRATRDAATAATAGLLADELARHGLSATVARAGGVTGLGGYRAVVLGGALRAGHWPAGARRFLLRHNAVLHVRPVWLFRIGTPVVGPACAPPTEWAELDGPVDPVVLAAPPSSPRRGHPWRRGTAGVDTSPIRTLAGTVAAALTPAAPVPVGAGPAVRPQPAVTR